MGMQIVRTTRGSVQGKDCKTYTIFKGIPYAAPPIGEKRFKYPQEMPCWQGIRKTDTFSHICPQNAFERDSFYWKEFYQADNTSSMISEDCLYLNLWTPAESGKERLPVVVWIHGGALTHGYGHEIEFDGENFCKKGVILVTVNYRLGIFGYFSHPWLEKESGCSGNYGLMDQIAALRWVQDNIEFFGGDASNITVMGQSAGAFSVQALLTSKLAKGLFAKAILQSGVGLEKGTAMVNSKNEVQLQGDEFVKEQGILSLSELRDLSAEELLSRSQNMSFTMTVDGRILEEDPAECLAKGKQHNVPCLLGSNKQDLWVSDEMVRKGIHGKLYHDCEKLAEEAAEKQMQPYYLYYFAHELPGDHAGAFHSAELWYLFGTLKRCWRPFRQEDYELSEKLSEYWTQFMKYSNPNGDNLPVWKPYTEKNRWIQYLE